MGERGAECELPGAHLLLYRESRAKTTGRIRATEGRDAGKLVFQFDWGRRNCDHAGLRATAA